MTSVDASPVSATEALVERFFNATIAALETASVHLGHRLGYYRILADDGPATPAELAARTRTFERYAREWLEQQAAAGLLSVDDPSAAAGERRYRLPEAHRPVLVEAEDINFMAPLATLAVGVIKPIDAVLEAYRTGGGVPYEAYGADTREGIAAINRPMFVNQLADWLRADPEIDARLRADAPARVADVACGEGWSSIAIARAYPGATVVGIDVDADSVAAAQRTVQSHGLDDRVRIERRDASEPDLGGPYDLITIFEALHDMNHPVQALRAAAASLAEGGSVLVGDEKVAERFEAPGDELERYNYGWSVLHCLPVASLEPDSAGTGTVMRAETVRSYAAQAGLGRVDVLPIEHDFWRFYRLRPR